MAVLLHSMSVRNLYSNLLADRSAEPHGSELLRLLMAFLESASSFRFEGTVGQCFDFQEKERRMNPGESSATYPAI